MFRFNQVFRYTFLKLFFLTICLRKFLCSQDGAINEKILVNKILKKKAAGFSRRQHTSMLQGENRTDHKRGNARLSELTVGWVIAASGLISTSKNILKKRLGSHIVSILVR